MISKEELLYFSLKHQHLLAKTDKDTVVSDLCGLQAQFANNPKYALRIRASNYSETGWGAGLIKVWSFRGTLHAVRKDELGLFLSARGVKDTWDNAWGIDPEIKPHWAQRIYDWIASGVDGREELKEKCRAKGMEQEVLEKVFHGWGGLIREMCDRGMIAYHIGTAKRFVLCHDVQFSDQKSARMEVIKRYFKAFGPATATDCAAFTGYRKTDVIKLIEESGMQLKSVFCEGVEYFHLTDLHSAGSIPDCLYLTGFDQLILGYKDRSRFLRDEDKRQVTTTTGIVFPTILVNGSLQAKWKKDGTKLMITPFSGSRKLSKRNKDLISAQGRALFGTEIKEVVYTA